MQNQDIKVRSKIVRVIWASLLFSGPIMLMMLYLAGIGDQDGIPAKFELYFLVAGIASGMGSMLIHKRFVLAIKASARPADKYLNKVMEAMLIGMSASEAPFLIGVVGWVAGGFERTAIVLTVLTFLLQLRFRPPKL